MVALRGMNTVWLRLGVYGRNYGCDGACRKKTEYCGTLGEGVVVIHARGVSEDRWEQ